MIKGPVRAEGGRLLNRDGSEIPLGVVEAVINRAGPHVSGSTVFNIHTGWPEEAPAAEEQVRCADCDFVADLPAGFPRPEKCPRCGGVRLRVEE